MVELLEDIEGFIWDSGNREKSIYKHGIENSQSEEVFFNFNFVYENGEHSKAEPRYRLLGKTNDDLVLFLVFTIRSNKIRIISSRKASKKENIIYHEETKKNSKI